MFAPYRPHFRSTAFVNPAAATCANPATATAAVNAYETAEQVVLHFDVPGYSKDAFGITVDKGVLTVKGQRTQTLPEGAQWLRQENTSTGFERSFRLPEDADTDNITATYADGVLAVTLTRKPRATKTIPVA